MSKLANFIFPKCRHPLCFLRFLCDVSCTFCHLIQQCSDHPNNFSHFASIQSNFFEMHMLLSQQSRAPFANLISQKVLNQAFAIVSCTFCRPHLPNVLWARSVSEILTCNSSSGCGLMHILPTSSSKSASHPSVF